MIPCAGRPRNWLRRPPRGLARSSRECRPQPNPRHKRARWARRRMSARSPSCSIGSTIPSTSTGGSCAGWHWRARKRAGIRPPSVGSNGRAKNSKRLCNGLPAPARRRPNGIPLPRPTSAPAETKSVPRTATPAPPPPRRGHPRVQSSRVLPWPNARQAAAKQRQRQRAGLRPRLSALLARTGGQSSRRRPSALLARRRSRPPSLQSPSRRTRRRRGGARGGIRQSIGV